MVCPSEDVREICRALGLDPKQVTALTLRMRPNDLVTVHVRMMVSPEQGQELKEIWRRYALTPLEQQP